MHVNQGYGRRQLWNIVVVFRRRRAHAPSIHAASYFDQEQRVAWFSISIHVCDSVPRVVVFCLAAIRAAGALV